MHSPSKILIVGAGFSGAVVARELAEAGFQVDVIDKRSHIGGNAWDYTNEHGIRIHRYGPHLFHTNNEKVYSWLCKFTQWTPYKHKVKAMLADGRLVTFPVNRETKNVVGEENLIETFIRPYSEKMWGIPLEKLDSQVTSRVPFREDDNEYYFPNDRYQCMPRDGYSKLFMNILDHPNIRTYLETPFTNQMESEYFHVFSSMPIDEYYGYRFGELPYRSIKFHHISLPLPRIFDVACVNFTHQGKYTRINEWKNLPGHGQNDQFTSLTYEEPCDYRENYMERYYPVKDMEGKNRELHTRYLSIPNKNVTFMGRLGLYVYLDMHQCISSAIIIAQKFIQKSNSFWNDLRYVS